VRGSRTPAGHALEGGAEHARDIGGAIEHGVPLGQRFHQRALIELSQREFVSGTYCDVRVDGENRNRRFVRLGEAGKEVGRAAARGTFADADSSGDARVAVGHVGRVPFIPCQYMLDRTLTRERVVEREAGVAAQAEDHLDAVRAQHFHDRLGSGHGSYIT